MPGKRLKASAHRSPGRRSGPQAATELFHALLEYSADAVALLDETGAISYVSQAATRLLGYGVSELTGTNAMGFLHPDDLALAQRLCRQLLDQPGTPLRTELRARHKDGSYHLVEAVAVNRLDDPAVGAVVANWRDITERLRAEELLKQVIDADPSLVFVKDWDGKFTLVNKAVAQAYATSPGAGSRHRHLRPQADGGRAAQFRGELPQSRRRRARRDLRALTQRRGDLAQCGLRGDDGVPARRMGRPAVRGLR